MLRIRRQEKKLEPVPTIKMAEHDIWERRDLQEYIWNSFDEIGDELDEGDLTLIGKEVRPSEKVDDRIDLLGLDNDGTLVVIELKRSKDKLQLLQAVAYAAMLSRVKDITGLLGIDKQSVSQTEDDSETAEIPINTGQRIVLIAEDYDYEVLVTAQWLGMQGVGIKCVRVTVASDKSTNAEYLSFSVVFPPRELGEEAKQRKSSSGIAAVATTWPAFLGGIKNAAEREFLENHRGATGSVPGRFSFRLSGYARLVVRSRPKFALVEQKGRFPGDLEFWQARLPAGANVREVFAGERVRFRLYSPQDFQAFDTALRTELQTQNWERSKPAPNVLSAHVQSPKSENEALYQTVVSDSQ